METKRILQFALCSVFLVFGSCAEKKDRKTEIFSNYLESEFHQTIPDNLHYFVLVPRMGCKGCFDLCFTELNQYINKGNVDKFTFITSNSDVIPDELKKQVRLMYDKSGTLDILNLDITNVTLVETEDEKVVFIKSFSLVDANTITSVIK